MKRDRDQLRGELSEYFAHEDMGAPGINPQPRAGTTSLDPRPPTWGPGVDPELMAAVFRRLCAAQAFTEINVFRALRARYGQSSAPRDHARIAADQAKDSKWAAQIDHVEYLYARCWNVAPVLTYQEKARRRLDAMWSRVFGP